MFKVDIKRKRKQVKIHVPRFKNEELYEISKSFCQEVDNIGWYFRNMEFSAIFSEEELSKANPEVIKKKLRKSFEDKFETLLDAKDIRNPTTKFPCLRTSPDKVYLWEKPDGSKFIIESGNY